MSFRYLRKKDILCSNFNWSMCSLNVWTFDELRFESRWNQTWSTNLFSYEYNSCVCWSDEEEKARRQARGSTELAGLGSWQGQSLPGLTHGQRPEDRLVAEAGEQVDPKPAAAASRRKIHRCQPVLFYKTKTKQFTFISKRIQFKIIEHEIYTCFLYKFWWSSP